MDCGRGAEAGQRAYSTLRRQSDHRSEPAMIAHHGLDIFSFSKGEEYFASGLEAGPLPEREIARASWGT